MRREAPTDVGALDALDPARSPEEQLVISEELQLLERALGALSLEQRAVFALFELERMSSEDIATALEIPLGTVYSRLRLGREAFRKALRLELARRSAVSLTHMRIAASATGRTEHD